MWTPPPRFDEHRLGRKLGAGAVGEVYVAHDEVLGRDVAVKFLSALELTPEARERFVAEARALARLQHANVVTLFRVGEAAGRPYLVSELLRGHSLAELARPVAARQLLELALGLARGLGAAHRRGVLHRDLKPANVFLTDDGVVKLIDFGLAVVAEDGAPLKRLRSPTTPEAPAQAPTQPPSAVGLDATMDSEIPPAAPGRELLGAGPAPALNLAGSPLYMSPEAWRGEAPTAASDVYCAGLVLYELAAGRLPFEGNDATALARERQSVDLPPVASQAPGLDARLAAIIDACVRRNPTLRPRDGDALRAQVEALLEEPLVAGTADPYPGLAAFEAEQRGVFFGRAEDARAVIERLRVEPWVVITADSGVGKSSLVRAGVLPAIAAGALGARLPTAVWTPGTAPLLGLATLIAGWLERSEESLVAQLEADPLEVGRALRRRFPAGVVVLADQLEELCTLASPAQASTVARVLTSLAVDARALRVIGTVRSDFLSRVLALDSFPESLARACLVLRPLTREGLVDAIVRPALAHGFRFEAQATVDALVEAAREGEGALPLLQFTLAELWALRDRDQRVIPASALEQVGGVAGCLARHSDQLLASLTPPQRLAARTVLLRLVTHDDTRARRSRSALLDSAGDPDVTAQALDALIRGRLLTSAGDEGGNTVVQLAHEALLLHWTTLRGWLTHDSELRRIAGRLERASTEWVRLGRPVELLLRPRQLLEAEDLPQLWLSAIDREFLTTSRRRLRLTVLRRAVLMLALLATVTLALAPVAKSRYDAGQRKAFLLQQATALEADARRLTTQLEHERSAALAHFDARETERAEAQWRDVLARHREADAKWHAVESALEEVRKFTTDPEVHRAQSRTLVARVRLQWLMAPLSDVTVLLSQLAEVDDGEGRADLRRTAHVRLELPPGVVAEVHALRPLLGGERPVSHHDVTGTAQLDLELGVWELRLTRGELTVRDELAVTDLTPLTLRPEVPLAAPPAGFVFIPTGNFLTGTADDDGLRRYFLRATPLHVTTTPAFLIATHELTLGEWLEFLDTLPAARQQELRPNAPGYNGLSLERAGRSWKLVLEPSSQRYVLRLSEPLTYPERPFGAFDWRRLPVTGIRFDDARVYARWLATTGRVPNVRLCTSLEWERAARGADGRRYPTGDTLDANDANIDATWGRRPTAFGPDPVGSHPGGVSPFGLFDAAGNAWEMVEDGDSFFIRGGGWYESSLSAMLTNHEPGEANTRDSITGVRLCATP